MEINVLHVLLEPSMMLKMVQKPASPAVRDPPQQNLEAQSVVCIKN